MNYSAAEIIQFRTSLLGWYGTYRRDLPWRRTRDPYAIWISEVMLQQTRVAAVIPYYRRFLNRFPTYAELAGATEADLLAHWAGLGYYYRARNLQKAALMMLAAGEFPAKYDQILALPGIGEYTAAAVASISFEAPYPVVDGNVFRVLSRVCNDATNIAGSTARRHFTRLAGLLLDREQPGTFNQAVMELGATVCLPKNPGCLVCPVGALCQGRREGVQNSLPVKTKIKRNVEEERHLLWIQQNGGLLLWQRPADSRLMPGFWELPEQAQLPDVRPGRVLGEFRHGITFHNYRFIIHEAAPNGSLAGCRWLDENELATAPLSTVLRKAQKLLKATYARAASSSH